MVGTGAAVLAGVGGLLIVDVTGYEQGQKVRT